MEITQKDRETESETERRGVRRVRSWVYSG